MAGKQNLPSASDESWAIIDAIIDARVGQLFGTVHII